MNLHNRVNRTDGTANDFELAFGDSSAGPEADLLADVIDQPAIFSLEKRRLQCFLAIMIVDIAAIGAGFAIGAALHRSGQEFAQGLLQAQLIVPVYLTIGLSIGASSPAVLEAGLSAAVKPLQALGAAALAMVLFTYFSKTGVYYSRLVFAMGIAGSASLLIAGRMAMRGFVRWRCGDRVENVLIVDDGGPAVELPASYHIDARVHDLRPDLGDPLALDRLSNCFAPMDRVLISCGPDRRVAWAMALKGLSVEGEVVDDTVQKMGALGARSVVGHGFLLVSHRSLGLRKRAMKRLFDLALTVPAILILAPVMLLTALAIKLEDGGPVLFVQQRTGRGSRFFRIFKFRSMQIANQDDRGELSASRDDDRVTRVGRFIRKTSIDELPQLINVLDGSMSLVGPRPHAPGSQAGSRYFWEIDERYWQRHMLKPGLTGLAQIRGLRGATHEESDLTERLQADLQYLDGWSIWRDIGILFATLRVVIHDRAF